MASDRECPLVYLLREPSDPDPYEETLREHGFRVRSFPVLSFHRVNQRALREALVHSECYGGVILTSPRSADVFADGLRASENVDPWREKPIYVVGPATAERVSALGLHITGADSGTAERLAGVITNQQAMAPLLFLCGNRSRDVIPERLQAARIPFEPLCVYETHLRGDLDFTGEEVPDWVVFFSPSGVEAIRQARSAAWPGVRRAAIGATTAQALTEVEWGPDAVADEPSPDGLLAALGSTSR